MKNYSTLLFILLSQFIFSQVGVGTDNPTPGYALDVNGSMLVQEDFKVNGYSNAGISSNDFKLLVRILNSTPPGEVAYLDMANVAVGPVNIADYVFTNLSRDNVTDVDLQFSATDYIVGLANFQYIGQHIVKGSGATIGHFRTRTFIRNGTWHLEMRNVSRDAASNNAITYNVTLIVYDRRYFKELPTLSLDMNGGVDGSIPAPVGL